MENNMENNNEKENILAELREVLMHGDFDLNQIEAIIRANEGLDLEELKKSLEKYKSYTKKYQETSELLDTYNTVMKEEMDSFRQEAEDIIDKFLIEKAKKEGFTYDPNKNKKDDN